MEGFALPHDTPRTETTPEARCACGCTTEADCRSAGLAAPTECVRPEPETCPDCGELEHEGACVNTLEAFWLGLTDAEADAIVREALANAR
jgi:hypothetical protein